MARREGYFILLKDIENPSLAEKSSWWNVLTSYVSSNEDDECEVPTQRYLALKGEILQALDPEKQPTDPNKIALRGAKQICLRFECDLEDVEAISETDAQLLLAVLSYPERLRIINEEGVIGEFLCEGSKVNVVLKELKKEVAGVVRYMGPVSPYDGIMFGIEIMDPRYRRAGTCDGAVQCNRYFRCAPKSGIFVSVERLRWKTEFDKKKASDDSGAQGEAFVDGKGLRSHKIPELHKSADKRFGIQNLEAKENDCKENKNNGEILQCSFYNDGKSDNDMKPDTTTEEVKVLQRSLSEKEQLLEEKTFKLQQQALFWEERLSIEKQEKKLCEEKLAELQCMVSKESLRVIMLEGRLEEEHKNWTIQRQAFHRDLEEFEHRLLEERAEKTRLEEDLALARRQVEEEQENKNRVEQELEAFKVTSAEQQQELQRQNELLEWRVRELESSTSNDDQVDKTAEACDWILSRDEIHVTEKRLGVGGWGQVMVGKFRACDVAVKQIHELILSPHNRRLFEREMSIASRCRHPCLLQFIGATNDDGKPLFVTELLDTNLRAVLESRGLDNAEIALISLDVAMALNYLHLNKPIPIIHRDISSANVLLWRRDNCWHAKVSDYGAANFMRHCRTVNPGAVIYSAPEALSVNQTPKIDVYSFGLLLCEMCIRELPVPGHTHRQIAMVTNTDLRDLINQCVHQEHEKRPDMVNVIDVLGKITI
ncbi:U-box domain-containing protein 33 [Nematostella vectensis]|uniref:U-box domain-containing protein 33 n=1 Tax=Nematostella vectensis TaxID=45351 RepID=UPI0020775531|nr:U-box domain-containing protein 33 [Nematostella vectensis]